MSSKFGLDDSVLRFRLWYYGHPHNGERGVFYLYLSNCTCQDQIICFDVLNKWLMKTKLLWLVSGISSIMDCIHTFSCEYLQSSKDGKYQQLLIRWPRFEQNLLCQLWSNQRAIMSQHSALISDVYNECIATGHSLCSCWPMSITESTFNRHQASEPYFFSMEENCLVGKILTFL